jgi:hypothetical protein
MSPRLILRILWIISSLTLLGSLVHWFHAESESLTHDGQEHARSQWNEGRCVECHNASADQGDKGSNQPPFHTASFRRFSHGRIEGDPGGKCFTCHSPQSCRSCHEKAPDSHTDGFLRPFRNPQGRSQHALLGKIRPAACIVCHQNLLGDCSDCHTPREMADWRSNTKPQLEKWPSLFGQDEKGDSL